MFDIARLSLLFNSNYAYSYLFWFSASPLAWKVYALRSGFAFPALRQYRLEVHASGSWNASILQLLTHVQATLPSGTFRIARDCSTLFIVNSIYEYPSFLGLHLIELVNTCLLGLRFDLADRHEYLPTRRAFVIGRLPVYNTTSET